ncbi:hypothetical protein LTR08_003293 [Meristemomyces frigidus]|nr:hypothetical protein LTR08_003293 [Meristemomyces frigidus]
MSRRALTLPLRVASSAVPKAQWVCRRCLATQAEATSSTANPPFLSPASDSPLQREHTPLSTVSDSTPPSYDASLPASQRIDPSTGRPYPLSKTDFNLKKPLGQVIPPQYLQHSTSALLHKQEQAQRAKVEGHRSLTGVVVSAGKMDKTVKVRIDGRRWEAKIGKYFPAPTNHLVHDPNSSLVPGDVVSLHRLRVSTAVHHVVANIVSPFGTPVDQRPPIPTPDDRLAAYKAKRFAKLDRRDLRRKAAAGDSEAIQELKVLGLDPGQGVQAGKGVKDGKGAVRGEKGQKLAKGVLPGGRHEVGKIDERAKHNKARAMRFSGKAEGNAAEAREKTSGAGDEAS